VSVRVGPVAGESIEPADDPFTLCDSLSPTVLVRDFEIGLRELARALLGTNTDQVLGPLDASRAVEIVSVWIDSILDCICLCEVGIGVIYVASQGSNVAYVRKDIPLLFLVCQDQCKCFCKMAGGLCQVSKRSLGLAKIL
jgi:hypothetical protein